MSKIRNSNTALVTGIFLVCTLASSVLMMTQPTTIAYGQGASNQITNQTGTNQSSSQSTNATSANATASKQPKLTTSDVQDIRKSLEEVKTSISEGKAIDALKTLNDIDDKLLVAMSQNPPPMLQKSTDDK